ncbi:prolipoprotein diacylglyceryl transferase [Estrella lausannensis]|uniref:Phosphatidylglycerol--prolipoprotein diacylglyceryl transferase n=1 Tax=Estrella lausannensis TaxID=483423 RepID=A0A0H5E7E0_9BACT|nr:prolipoprotein diacylglyceryl transferase [Estrella lausannensis]CRX39250.1 Prolipoprotein diacylglyceryl transferase [Estrella lausannensis]
MQNTLLSFYFDPDPIAFTVPYFDFEVRWYGILFALGFILGYFFVERVFFRMIDGTREILPRDIASMDALKKAVEKMRGVEGETKVREDKAYLGLVNRSLASMPGLKTRSDIVKLFPGAVLPTKELASLFTDRLLWFIIAGCIIGARLGHVLFYDLHYYLAHPAQIFNLRAGGLASHGGAVGVMLGLYAYTALYRSRFSEISFLKLLDVVVVPTALVAFFIRIGNFINQEILGHPTDMPWGVVFGHPVEGGGAVARHPVQLYEALFYLFTYVLLLLLANRLKVGRLAGLFFLLVFGSRFVLEFFKEPQSLVINEHSLLAGQLLSLPFIALSLYLLLRREAAPAKTE